MIVNLDPSWREVLHDELASPRFAALERFVDDEYAKGPCYPAQDHIFEAFNRTPFDSVSVVIIGQDPYHNEDQAHGLCFSVPETTEVPPSLLNIYKELSSEYGTDFTKRTGNLTSWAEQGVLLLNATLTVSGGADMAGSHQRHGWEQFTDKAIQALVERRENLVFLLWGAYAQKKAAFVDGNRHLILKAPHPSPLSVYRGFFGCNHFRQCNEYLESHGKKPIAW